MPKHMSRLDMKNTQTPKIGKRPQALYKRASVVIFFTVFLIYMEISLKIMSAMHQHSFASIAFSDICFAILFAIPVAFLFSFFCSLGSKKVNYRIACTITIVTTIWFMTQNVYFYIFKTYLQIYSVAAGTGQAMGFMSTIVSAIFANFFKLVFLALPMIFLLLFGKKILDFSSDFPRKAIISIAVSLGVFLISLFILWIGDHSLYSPYDLYHHTNSISLSVKKLGLLTSTRLDIKNSLFGSEAKILDIPEEQETPEELPVEEIEYDTIAKRKKPAQDAEATPKPLDTSPNILELDFDSLIESSPSENVTALHEFFQRATPTNKNEYTGMFEGKNLIMFTAEAFSHMAVHPDITPTLYKLVNSGFVFEDFYTPIWEVSTSDGEYVACTGLVPKSGEWSFQTSGENGNDMRFCMGPQFKKLGYSANGYHNHTYDYYGRHLSHPNMDYEYKALGYGLDVEEVWPESDLEMMEKTVDDWINNEKFHAYYMTVSGHMNYTFSDNMMSYRNKDLVDHLDLSDEAKAYYACNIELDKALEYLLKRLEEAGKLDSTVIVLSADHYPYGLDLSTINELSGHSVEQTFELYRNNCILWCSEMEEPVKITKPVCSMDIIPTVSNLFGLPYDSRMVMGTDALSDTDPLIVFEDTSFIKGDLKYNAKSGEYTSSKGTEYTEEQLSVLRAEVANKFRVSSLILDTDYYSYLP